MFSAVEAQKRKRFQERGGLPIITTPRPVLICSAAALALFCASGRTSEMYFWPGMTREELEGDFERWCTAKSPGSCSLCWMHPRSHEQAFHQLHAIEGSMADLRYLVQRSDECGRVLWNTSPRQSPAHCHPPHGELYEFLKQRKVRLPIELFSVPL